MRRWLFWATKEAKARTDLGWHFDRSALFFACARCDRRMVGLLLEFGAGNHSEIAKIMDGGTEVHALHRRLFDFDCLRLLLESRAGIDADYEIHEKMLKHILGPEITSLCIIRVAIFPFVLLLLTQNDEHRFCWQNILFRSFVLVWPLIQLSVWALWCTMHFVWSSILTNWHTALATLYEAWMEAASAYKALCWEQPELGFVMSMASLWLCVGDAGGAWFWVREHVLKRLYLLFLYLRYDFARRHRRQLLRRCVSFCLRDVAVVSCCVLLVLLGFHELLSMCCACLMIYCGVLRVARMMMEVCSFGFEVSLKFVPRCLQKKT